MVSSRSWQNRHAATDHWAERRIPAHAPSILLCNIAPMTNAGWMSVSPTDRVLATHAGGAEIASQFCHRRGVRRRLDSVRNAHRWSGERYEEEGAEDGSIGERTTTTMTSREPSGGLMQRRGMVVHTLVALANESASGAIQGDQRQV